jgi:hypothetical protein
MANRFCTRCNAEVEDTGGYCLLGHNLRLEAATDTLSALRAEVNRTFDEARDQLAAVAASPEAAPVSVTRATHLSTPPPPPGAPATPREGIVSEQSAPPPSPEFAAVVYTEEVVDAPVPSPAAATSHPSVWDALEDIPSLAADDPIASFAPPPRMDWGPRRSPRQWRPRAGAKVQPES